MTIMEMVMNSFEINAAAALPSGVDLDTVSRASMAISLRRIADAVERLGECADGIHPSAFRVLHQQ